jgi:hypothetical protein
MSNHDDDEDVEGALASLMEYQKKVNELAKGIVESYRKMLDNPEKLEPGYSKAFAKSHGAWYDSVEKDLVSLGFRPLGAYEDPANHSTPEDKRSFYRFALSAEGTITAAWFLVPSTPPLQCVVLDSAAEDGAKWITGSGIRDTGMPLPDNRTVRIFPAGAPNKGLVITHRRAIEAARTPLVTHTGMDSILAARYADAVAVSEFRKALGVGLFEKVIRSNYKTDEEFEENGRDIVDAIEENPHWWTGEEPKEDDEGESAPDDPNAPLRMIFMMSRDDESGRGHITTAGLLPRGLPELQMKNVAPNHCRAARFLMGNTARKLLQHAMTLPPADTPLGDRLSGTLLTMHGRESAGGRTQTVLGKFPETSELGEVQVELTFEEFGGSRAPANIFSMLLGGGRPNKLLRVTGPGSNSSDEWLRDATRRLGMDTPAALSADRFLETMTAASQRAVAGLQDFRARIRAGLPQGQFAVVKTGLATTTETREFVWVRVTETPDGEFVGILVSKPSDAPGYEMGQVLRIADKDVYDRGIFSETEGVLEPALTDVVAQEFGVDIPG